MSNILLIFGLSLASGIAATWLFETILKTNQGFRRKYYKNHNIVFGLHFHHSTYGIFFSVVSMLLLLLGLVDLSLFFVGFAIGIIVVHTISERRFVFIEKRSY